MAECVLQKDDHQSVSENSGSIPETCGKVSIIMPSYNTAGFIAESILSVQNQTYQNWELLIVDDCSTDHTEDVIRPFLSDPRILLFRNESNQGAAISRNRALKEATGKWIAFLDSDDVWQPDKLEKQIAFMKDNRYSFSYTCYGEMDEAGNDTGIRMTGPAKIGKRKMQLCDYVGCLTVMYDAETMGLIQIPDIKKRNDWAIWLCAIQKAPCYLLNENLAWYRVRKSGSLSNIKGGKIRLIKYHYRFFRQIEHRNPVSALFLTGINLVAVIHKKAVYRSGLK